jgi:ribosomal protein S12 methylthiotransferase accessory factor
MIVLHRPRFKPHFHVEALDGEGVLVLSEVGQTLLRGRLHELVTPLIDGRRGADDLVSHLSGEVDPAAVYYTLAELERRGYLCESGYGLPDGEAALWSIHNIDAEVAARRLAEARVSLTAFGDVDLAPFQQALESLHISIADSGSIAGVLTDDYLRSGLEAFNRNSLDELRSWLLVKPVGWQIWVGPFFRPGHTGCWECLAQRLRANRGVEVFVQDLQGRVDPISVARAFTTGTVQIASNLAGTEVAKWIARGESSELEGKLLTLDVRSWQTQTHTLVRLPQCPACGRPEKFLDRPAPAVVLESRKKTFMLNGGYRVQSPQETLQRYQHHVSPIIGAVSTLERLTTQGDGILHVYGAGENPVRRPQSLEDVRRDLRSGSSGKGTSDVEARASGLCEALERSSGVFRGDEPRRNARFKDLGTAAIHPNACMLYSDRQYAERDAWNARKSRWHDVPIKFDEEATVDWTPVWSLTRQQVCYLPTAFCYFRYPHPAGESDCVACSNGNAAGNTLEEAMLQGFFELVERDAVAMWWYNRVQRPAVDPNSFGERYLDQVADFLSQRQRDLWVLDVTTDLDIPVFVAVSRRTQGPFEKIVLGFGAHFDPRVALLRAVTELNQMLVYILDMDDENDLATTIDDPETVDWLQTAALENHPHLMPDARNLPRTLSDYPHRWTDDLRDDVLLCQRLVERHGMEMLVLDQTRADIGLPVVKVIVPGLRHFWARFAPGRLYDVPVRLGWLPQPLHEEQLNPIPMFM